MPAENNDARIANIARIWHSLHYRWMKRRQKPRRNQRPYWDALILTAANRTQARGFELEAALRKETGVIEPETQVLVVPDRAGKRIGSGGATLWALKQYAKHALADKRKPRSVEELFAGRRILIMHCGGEGRREPGPTRTSPTRSSTQPSARRRRRGSCSVAPSSAVASPRVPRGGCSRSRARSRISPARNRRARTPWPSTK